MSDRAARVLVGLRLSLDDRVRRFERFSALSKQGMKAADIGAAETPKLSGSRVNAILKGGVPGVVGRNKLAPADRPFARDPQLARRAAEEATRRRLLRLLSVRLHVLLTCRLTDDLAASFLAWGAAATRSAGAVEALSSAISRSQMRPTESFSSE